MVNTIGGFLYEYDLNKYIYAKIAVYKRCRNKKNDKL